jgi:hypothetical protein
MIPLDRFSSQEEIKRHAWERFDPAGHLSARDLDIWLQAEADCREMWSRRSLARTVKHGSLDALIRRRIAAA